MIFLGSDNASGAAPEIMDALIRANHGTAAPYGADAETEHAVDVLRGVFDSPEALAFPVVTGSAANALALSCLCPPYGSVLCHRTAHIQTDECGAPEFYSAGAKLILIDGDDGKITPDGLEEAIARETRRGVHRNTPHVLSLTNLTELGTAYTVDEVAALADIAKRAGLTVHLDGARFANAIAGLGVEPAEMSWRAGVDVLSLGATKNGCLAAEAVLFFSGDDAIRESFERRRKRGAHLLSKMRFVSVQLIAYLEEDRWLDWARHANACAARLADGLARVPGCRVARPVDGNEVFVELAPAVAQGLADQGVTFYDWGDGTHRFVAAFNTEADDIDHVIASAKALAAKVA